MGDNNFHPRNPNFTAEELYRSIRLYEAITEVLTAILITGCYWGSQQHNELWVRCIQRVANAQQRSRGLVVWLNLSLYPSLLLIYAGGIAAIASKNYNTLADLLLKAVVRDVNDTSPVVLKVFPIGVMEDQVAKQLPGMERRYTPVSDHLLQVLREPLREFIPEDDEYQGLFDRFEYLSALLHADVREKSGRNVWAPFGRFGWRTEIIRQIQLEAEAAGDGWFPLKAGLFDGSLARFQTIKQSFDALIPRLLWH